MIIKENYSLLAHNTFRLPVKTRWFIEYSNASDLEKILSDEYFQELPSLHIGEGSNLLFINDYGGVVFHSAIKGMEVERETAEEVWLRVGAGERWDDVVAHTVQQGWGGIENLSGIPGEAGAAAVQNIGAYGVELKDVVETVEAYAHFTIEKKCFTAAECAYGYRTSRFKDEMAEPHYITHLTLRLQKNPTFHLDYGSLRTHLDPTDISLQSVRSAIQSIRAEKLPDPKVLGNAGSFFMNPTVSKATFEALRNTNPTIPSYPANDDGVKIPAAWLIEQCGFKGQRYDDVGVYEKQALVLVNHGDARGHEIALLAESIRTAVQQRFGVELLTEVKYIG